MLKRLFWIGVGAAAALQADRWLGAKKAKLSPSGMTSTLLDNVNQRLESKRASSGPPSAPGG